MTAPAREALEPLKPLSRSVETSVAVTLDTPEQIAYQHSVPVPDFDAVSGPRARCARVG